MTPTTPKTPMNPRTKKALIIASVAIGAILLGAIVFGVLNATVGGGKWLVGWNDYRYDDTNFEMGDATVPSQTLTEIEIDWLDGAVLIIPCEDTYPSLTEKTENGSELPDSARLRWCVSDGGTKLTVKYRASSWFFGIGKQSRHKTLTLRIPKRMLEGIGEIDVTTDSGNIVLDQIDVSALELETASGNIRVQNSTFEALTAENTSGTTELSCNVRGRLEFEGLSGSLRFDSALCPQSLDIETQNADVTLMLPPDAAFVLQWETNTGNISSDFAYTVSGNQYTVGGGTAHFTAETQSGDLMLAKHAAAGTT